MAWIFCACLLFVQTHAQNQEPTGINSEAYLSSKVPFDPEVKKGVLENGLTYYIKTNPKPEDKVELRLVVNAGSILENDKQRGLAHFMEHMNFNGTKNFKKNELVDYLQSIGVKFGAHLNAYTSFDETVYILPIPSDDPEKLEKGFQILEDWAHNALLLEKDIDAERGVVLEEYRLGQGAQERMLQEYLPKVMYGSKYADRLPIGTKETLENFEYETLRNYYETWYRPDLMAVIAVGDVDASVLEKKIKEHFGDIPMPKNPKERKVFNLPNHEETLIAIASDKEAAFSRVQVYYKDKQNAEPDVTLKDYRDYIVESLFSQMINNRLDEIRNSANPPFVFAASYHGGTWARSKEAYQSFAMTSETGQLDALKVLLEENERVERHGFLESELERAKQDMLARYEKMYKDRDKRESERIVGEYIRNYLEQEVVPGMEWEYKFLKKQLPTVNVEEVNALISGYLKDENRVIVITGPEKEGDEKITEEEVKAVLASVENAKIEAYKEEAVAESLIKGLNIKPGSISKVETDEKLGTTILTLSNGAKVTYKKTDFKNDEVLFEAFSYGGTSLYPDEIALATVFANRGLAEAGVNGFNKNMLNKMLSGKIVSVNPDIGTYSEGFSGNASPEDLEELFQLVHLYFTELNKDEEAFDSYISRRKSLLGNLLSMPQFYFQIKLSEFISGSNPRYVGFPTPEKLDKANYDLAYEKYQERFADAGDFHFYFVGNIDEAKLKTYAETYLASLPSTNSSEEYVVRDWRPLSGSHEKTIEKGKDPKSAVRIIYQDETTYNEKEDFALQVLGEVLTIKLIEKLREEEGGVYGAGARGNMRKIPYGWYRFIVSFPCGPENVEKLKKAALAEVDKLVAEGPTQKDLDKVIEARLLERKEELKQNKFWIETLKDADYQKDDAHEIFEYEESLSKITTGYLQKIAEKYLTNGYILAIHNPESE